jgi:hypothetical protein
MLVKNKINKIKVFFLSIIVLMTPLIIHASDFKAGATKIISYTQFITNALIGITLAFFFWGIFIMLSSGENSKIKESAKSRISWGIIILFVLFSVWSILAFLKNTTNLVENKIEIDITKLPDAIE